jgi:hypothetical protein
VFPKITWTLATVLRNSELLQSRLDILTKSITGAKITNNILMIARHRFYSDEVSKIQNKLSKIKTKLSLASFIEAERKMHIHFKQNKQGVINT